MISGLWSAVQEKGLPTAVALEGAVLGVAAGVFSDVAAVETLLAAAAAKGFSLVVVFDGLAANARSLSLQGLPLRRTQLLLTEKAVPWLVAPGNAAAQLAALFRANIITHVMSGGSGDETLLFANVPVVQGAQKDEPKAVVRSQITAAFNLIDDTFVEAALGSGCSLNPDPSSLLIAQAPAATGFNAALKISDMGGGSFYRGIVFNDPDYVPTMQKALATVAWQQYLDEDGEVVLSNRHSQPIPRDLHEVIGYRLPDEYIWFAQQGFVGADVLRPLVWGAIEDSVPASSAEAASKEHAALQRAFAPLRQKALALTVLPMNRWFHMRPLEDRSVPGTKTTVPRIATLAPSFPRIDVPLTAPKDIMDDLVSRTLEVAGLSGDPAKAPTALLEKVASGIPVDETSLAAATLVLRTLAEAVLVYRMATGQFGRSVDRLALLQAFPWA